MARKKKGGDLAGMATMLLAATGGAVAGNFADKLMRENVAFLQNNLIRNAVKIGIGVGLGYALKSPMATNFGAGMALSGTVGLASNFIPGITGTGYGYPAMAGTGYGYPAMGNYADLEPSFLNGTGEEVNEVISGTGAGREISSIISGYDEYGDEEKGY